MWITAVFAAAIAVVLAQSATVKDKCAVGEWGEWSECGPSKSCQVRPLSNSYAVEPTEEWDSGRVKMEYMMKVKQQYWQEKAECLAKGTCPELASRPSGGPQACISSMAGDLPCKDIDQSSFINIDDMGYDFDAPAETTRSGNDIWGWTDPLTADEYAIVGLTGGTAFVRVTDPQNPVAVGFLVTHTDASVWRDVKVHKDHAFIVSEATDHGMQVFDLTQLRLRTELEYDFETAHYARFGNCHNIIANEETGFLYAVGSTRGSGYNLCSGGLHVINVNVPANPTYAGCFGGDGYTHDAQCVVYRGPDIRYFGREICFAYNENTFTIVDVENKADMHVISKTGYTGVEYTHQGWLTEDHTVVLLDDELDESRSFLEAGKYTRTYIWDVRDLQFPVNQNTFIGPVKSIDHNQYVKGNYVYQSNYEAGLRILSIDQDNFDLTELAYFDVFPSGTSASFNGAWSVYPYFPSGNIILSSIDFGLFVLKPNMVAIEEQRLGRKEYAEKTRTRKMLMNAGGATCPPLVDIQQCEPTQC